MTPEERASWDEGYDFGIEDAAKSAKGGTIEKCPILDNDSAFYLGYQAGWTWIKDQQIEDRRSAC
jgi:hypothetical protein